MTTFSELNLDPKVLQAVHEAGYTTPTPIQEQAIPHALGGRDVLGIAQTGTGKTAAFTLPMICRLAKGRARARMPRTLVLCPTRELAAQVSENFETYGKHHKLTMALLIGGVSFKDQDKLIDRGVDVLIATPGRLLDHFERGKLMLTGIEVMVVDEADRMLDMGFIPDIERIFKLTPPKRQTLFFSATMPPEITRLTREFLNDPVRVEVAKQATTGENIAQRVIAWSASSKMSADAEKRDMLRALIDAEGEKLTNAIVFCNRKSNVDVVAKSLAKHGYDAAPIHGDLDQKIRTRTLDSFRANELKILVASDVAARGLDIPLVSHVFNFDVPIHSEDYVHRIGRTGRAGRSGDALTLCLPHEEKYLDKIEAMIGAKIERAEAPGLSPRPERREPARSEEQPRRSRSRGPRREEPKPEAAAPAVEAEALVALEPETQTERPRAEPRRREPQQPRRGGERRSDGRGDGGRGDGGGAPVLGLGDHMPAFMTIPLPKLKPARAGADEIAPEDASEDAVA